MVASVSPPWSPKLSFQVAGGGTLLHALGHSPGRRSLSSSTRDSGLDSREGHGGRLGGRFQRAAPEIERVILPMLQPPGPWPHLTARAAGKFSSDVQSVGYLHVPGPHHNINSLCGRLRFCSQFWNLPWIQVFFKTMLGIPIPPARGWVSLPAPCCRGGDLIWPTEHRQGSVSTWVEGLRRSVHFCFAATWRTAWVSLRPQELDSHGTAPSCRPVSMKIDARCWVTLSCGQLCYAALWCQPWTGPYWIITKSGLGSCLIYKLLEGKARL